MSLPKVLSVIAVVLFGLIAVGAAFKKDKKTVEIIHHAELVDPYEVELDQIVSAIDPVTDPLEKIKIEPLTESVTLTPAVSIPMEPLPEANRVEMLFSKTEPKLPIVETVVYQSRASWQKGRPAWLSDYASHYQTSRHFIARSLNGKPDYFKQEVSDGDRFNVFRLDKNINFYLLIDISRSKLWLYYIDTDSQERVLLKTYTVGLGRPDENKQSGYLTPLGKYSLGNKIAIYKPKVTGLHNGENVEMIKVFGTRWIPFEKEISGTTAPAKGFGIHGIPWVSKNNSGELLEDESSLGKHESDGCIRLATRDMEEVFAIIITKPATVEIVAEFHDAVLPGKENLKI